MFVSDWMKKEVVTVSPGESVRKAVRMMEETGLKHLVVVEQGVVRGVLSDRDVRAFTPAKTSVRYLLPRARVRNAMNAEVVTAAPDMPIEAAARTMLERNIRCLPVVEAGRLVGIVSDQDIFRALVDISGIRHGGHRICVIIEDRSGTIREVTDVARRLGFQIRSILTSYEGLPTGSRRIVVRTSSEGDFDALRSVFETVYRDVRIQKG